MTPLEFVELEFPTGTEMTKEDWLRKMDEYTLLQQSKLPLKRILELDYESKNALRSAVDALYFDDNSDYRSALWEVVAHLTKIPFHNMTDDLVTAIHTYFQPK